MSRKPFSALKEPILKDPVERAAVDEIRRAIRDIAALTEARENQGLTQQELADRLGVSQANISRIEHEEDLYLSTLRSYVEALGGELQVKAVFEDQEIYLAVPGTRNR
jgi:DNA-binding XRE family transcriptional regulator